MLKLVIGFGVFLFIICAIGPVISIIVSVHVAQKRSKDKQS